MVVHLVEAELIEVFTPRTSVRFLKFKYLLQE